MKEIRHDRDARFVEPDEIKRLDATSLPDVLRDPEPQPEREKEESDLERLADVIESAPDQELSYVDRFRFEEAQKRRAAEWEKKYQAAKAYLTSPIKAAELDADITSQFRKKLEGEDA